MAKQTVTAKTIVKDISRPGIHAKTKTSKIVAKELFDDLFAKEKGKYIAKGQGK